MTINTKFSIGEQVMFEYGPNKVKTWGDVCRISATISKTGRVNVEYWVIFGGSCGLWIKEKDLSK